MKEKTFRNLEICGVGVCFFIWLILHNVNSFENDHLINVMFGSVNNSVWESLKIILLGLLFWSVIELCWAKPFFRKFVVVKTLSLYIFGTAYCLIITTLRLWGTTVDLWTEVLSVAVFAVLFHFFSYKMMKKPWNLRSLFFPCLFLLLLFSVIYVCFTPYPPRFPAFYDFENKLYGIIPSDFDRGAIFLDSLYGK